MFYGKEGNILNCDYMHTETYKDRDSSSLLKLLYTWILYLDQRRPIKNILGIAMLNIILGHLHKIWLPILLHKQLYHAQRKDSRGAVAYS